MSKKLKILLLSGKLANEHNMVRMNGYLREILESTGRFEVKVTEEFNGATPRTLEGYDAILLNYDGKDYPTDSYHRLEPGAEKVFFDFVRNGGGLYIHHSCVWLEDGLPEEYKKCWGYFTTMPESRKAPWDDLIVKNMKPDDPIMKGIDDYMIVGDDLFAGVVDTYAKDCEVLAAIYDDIKYYEADWWPPQHHPVLVPEGKKELMRGVNTWTPVLWKNTFGKGRVIGHSVGHDIDTYRRFNWLGIFVRSMEWVACGQVTLDKPDRIGENRLIPFPYYTPEMTGY